MVAVYFRPVTCPPPDCLSDYSMSDTSLDFCSVVRLRKFMSIHKFMIKYTKCCIILPWQWNGTSRSCILHSSCERVVEKLNVELLPFGCELSSINLLTAVNRGAISPIQAGSVPQWCFTKQCGGTAGKQSGKACSLVGMEWGGGYLANQ